MNGALAYPKGHEFHGPDGQGYRAKRDIYPGDLLLVDDFEAFGGAPDFVAGDVMSGWLARELLLSGTDSE